MQQLLQLPQDIYIQVDTQDAAVSFYFVCYRFLTYHFNIMKRALIKHDNNDSQSSSIVPFFSY